MSHNAGGRHGYYPAGPYPVPPPSTTVTAPGGGQPGAAQMKNAFESFLNSQGHLPPPSTASASASSTLHGDYNNQHAAGCYFDVSRIKNDLAYYQATSSKAALL